MNIQKNFLITGANSYLGKAIFEIFKNKGYRLLLVTHERNEFGNIDSNDIRVIKGIDLLNETHLEKLSSEVRSFFSEGFNIINCVGFYEGQKPFEKTSIQESIKIFNSNFVTIYGVASTLIPIMAEEGGGHFICFSCNSVRYNYPQMAPFTAAKSALESLMRSLANEFYDRGIYANSFQLSTLLTDFELKVKPHGDHGNWLPPQEVAEYIDTFVSQKPQIVNGATINLYHYSDTFFHSSYFDRIKQ